jgi:hypothetical protein
MHPTHPTLVKMGNCLRKTLRKVIVSAVCDSWFITACPSPRVFRSPSSALNAARDACHDAVCERWDSAPLLLVIGGPFVRVLPMCPSARYHVVLRKLLSKSHCYCRTELGPRTEKAHDIVAEPTNHHHRCQSVRHPTPHRILLQQPVVRCTGPLCPRLQPASLRSAPWLALDPQQRCLL